MLCTTTFELAVDQKCRITIPAAVHRELDPEVHGTAFYLVPGKYAKTLDLFPDQVFRRAAEQRAATLEPCEELELYNVILFAQATLLEMDKQRRVVLPQRMLEKAGIGDQINLSGAGDHLILWDREEYERFMDEKAPRAEDFRRQAELKTQLLRQSGGARGQVN